MDTYIDIDIDTDIHAICSNMSGPGVGSKIPIKFRRSSVRGSLPRMHVLSAQLCPPLCRPWDSPGKNTGVGCHLYVTTGKSHMHSGLLCIHV